jgi:hypothetical protein
MEIRREAALDLPHILLLVDVDKVSLLPALGERARNRLLLYDTPLMLGAGKITGWLLDKEADWALLAEGLETLASRAMTRYGPTKPGDAPFLFAAGDGNHSLATAKAVWEEYKKAHAGEPGLENHPARWALAELENLYDSGISFEPIHRILFGANMDETLAAMAALPSFTARPVSGPEELSAQVADPTAPTNRYGLISAGRYVVGESSGTGGTSSEASSVATGDLQPLLDRFLEAGGQDLAIDYIHGEEVLFKLAEQNNAPPQTGILLPPIKKAGLFQTVARSGPLPRKSFSMGEAEEKRFYFECRKLFEEKK